MFPFTAAAKSLASTCLVSACRKPLHRCNPQALPDLTSINSIMSLGKILIPSFKHEIRARASFYSSLAATNREDSESPVRSAKVTWIAKLRKETSCTIPQAKKALEQAGAEGYEFALKLLVAQASTTLDSAKLGKLSQRDAKQGLIGAAVHPSRSFAVLACIHSETDFVAKSALFQELMQDMLRSTLFFQHSSGSVLEGNLLQMPIVPDFRVSCESLASPDARMESLEERIHSCMGKLGEKICLGDIDAIHFCPTKSSSAVMGAYVHSGGDKLKPGLGRIGAIVKLEFNWKPVVDPVARATLVKELGTFADRLAQHVVGFNPAYLDVVSAKASNALIEEGQVFLQQPFLFGGGMVREVVDAMALKHADQISHVRPTYFSRQSIE